MEIEQSLGQLGLAPKEIKLYVALLKQKRLSPAELARQTKINRATVYHLLKSLVSRGIISEDLGGTKTSFVALPPSALEQLIEKQRQELKDQERLVQDAVAKLSVLTASQEYPVPKVRFVEQDQLKKFLYQENPNWVSSIMAHDPDKTWWGFQDHTLVEHYNEWIDWTWTQIPKGLVVKLLSNESSIERRFKGKYAPRNIRFLPNTDFTATTWVTGEFVTMIYTREKPKYLVEIHDARFAQNMREMFKRFWERME